MPTTEWTPLERVLGDDFDGLRPLGEDGGMSRLFRAHKKSLDMDVVIKRMKMDPDRPADVQREARVMTSLRHQFLPRIFDFKTDNNGYCYTIMELIQGCTLRQYVQRQGALNQKQALFWMKQLCQAAQYMHSQHPPIIHSDIKPENIMITPEGSLCLIDFNASLELRDDGVEAVGATLCYAAPEQYNVPLERFGPSLSLSPQRRAVYDIALAAQGMGKVTQRTDLYAIGAVAYYMLTGYDPPCWAQPPVPLSRYDITLGAPLCQVIERCMEHSSARRFSSAREVLRALENLARMDRRYRAWRRSCQAAALIIGAGLLLSAFSAAWGWMTLRQETGQAYNDLIRQAQLSGQQLDYAGQQELLLQAIHLERDRPEAYANLGALLYRLGDYQQAVELLSGLEPDRTGSLSQGEAALAQGQIQYVLASCYYQLQDYHQALACYQIAALFCPEEAAYHRDLAVCYAKLGYDSQAQKTVDELAHMAAYPGDQQLAAGEIAYSAGRFEEAFDLLSQAARLSEDHTVISRASLQAAQCCQQLGSQWLEQEAEVLERAAQRLDAAENSGHLQYLAETLIRLAAADPSRSTSHYEQALSHLQELMTRGHATFAVRQNTALVLEYLDQFQEAEQQLLQLQADYPQDYRPPMRLALLYMDQEGRKPSGQRNYQTVLQFYDQALALYAPSDIPDSDMSRLQELTAQLPTE